MKTQYRKYVFIVLIIIALFILSGCRGAAPDYKPIDGVNGFADALVIPIAGLMYFLGNTIAFHYYGLVILFATVIVRTLAWPIYAKTNDMTLKMQLMGPEQARIEQKYTGKTDQESNQKKQMEMMQLYKKYGVGIGGCLIQLVQFPIFIGFYNTLQRVPKTIGEEFTMNFGFLNTKFFGVDLFLTRTEGGSYQMWGVIILALLVGLTQITTQIIATRRQKKAKAALEDSVPQYRKPPQTEMQKQTEMTMKFMLYGMTFMMMFFVYSSTAALGLYWLVGNIFSALQSYIGHKRSQRRLETLKKRF